MKMRLRGIFYLLLTTIIWGAAFTAQSIGMDYIGPFTFQAIRCGMAAVGLLPVIWLFDRGKRDGKTFLSRFLDKRQLLASLLCALPLCFAANLQQVGMQYTSAGKAAFLTAMYIIFVPLIGIFFRQKCSPVIVISVAVAVAGLYFLTCSGVSSVNIGDAMLLLCAFGYGLQICLIDKYAADIDPLRLNFIQALSCSLVSFVLMLFTETPTPEGIRGSFGSMCYAGFMSMGVAYSFQIIGQKYVEPALASIILSMESVFAVLVGWMVLHEKLAPKELLGCALVLIAVMLAQIQPNRKEK